MKTKTVAKTELNVGNIVHFHGARFEIYSTTMYPQEESHIKQFGEISPTMVAMGKWLDGAIVNGYFGPTKDWSFQGNKLATVTIETNE